MRGAFFSSFFLLFILFDLNCASKSIQYNTEKNRWWRRRLPQSTNNTKSKEKNILFLFSSFVNSLARVELVNFQISSFGAGMLEIALGEEPATVHLPPKNPQPSASLFQTNPKKYQAQNERQRWRAREKLRGSLYRPPHSVRLCHLGPQPTSTGPALISNPVWMSEPKTQRLLLLLPFLFFSYF